MNIYLLGRHEQNQIDPIEWCLWIREHGFNVLIMSLYLIFLISRNDGKCGEQKMLSL